MIYTVTLNPSIDYVVSLEEFQIGGLNRSKEEAFLPGGKGNNVSVVLKHLGVESTALGFVAGFTGEKIEGMLAEKGVRTEFIKLPVGNSRINVKLHSFSDGMETEINGSGPEILQDNIRQLKDRLGRLEKGDTLILAGSIPPAVPDTIYEEICDMLSGRDVRIVVDAEKKLLERVLKYRPFLVKPNHHELGAIFGTEIRTKEEAVLYAHKLKELGACNVIVSMAEKGAVFLGENGEVYKMDAPKGTVVNSVGSGDSMIAGLLAVCDPEKGVSEDAFFTAVCAGSACAFLQGLPTGKDIETIKKQYRSE